LGQWLKGRIYEHRCDLSPSGQKLIYFAAKYGTEMRTWTAVSRPPFLTALALWPKGDAWGGGGLFENERVIQLNHGKLESKLAEEFKLPKTITVEKFGERSGRGEDEPIWPTRLRRDGWECTQRGKWKEHSWRKKVAWEAEVPEVWAKQLGHLTLQMILDGVHERDGTWYVMRHRMVDAKGDVVLDLDRSDWADWSRSGELLYAKEGCLFKVAIGKQDRPGKPKQLIDLSKLEFSSVEAPPKAKVWGGQPLEGVHVR
jgi:hypothetical protein